MNVLHEWPSWLLWIFFLAENALIVLIVLVWGNILLRRSRKEIFNYSRQQWRVCLLTTLLNALVTFTGFLLWKHGYIRINAAVSWRILTDALAYFLAMDLLMYGFHYIIHKTFLYRPLHRLHHEATDPVPIDLFVLHPLETISFGALLLIILLPFNSNIYGLLIYHIANVIFGMTGHLGVEPMPENIRQWPLMKYLGTSTFHHDHHRHEDYNFGFYTTIWDRLFGTLKR
ncbi:sterol desaturase family protein [Chitinophaga flava]|uniref:Fatty acid hydroxylase n=1 Tax=Chitinophaga flava TaxID=2259036 RepID=A0A365Y5Q1_9BACT|nr:sterol desaturase family protein [Chitinophaga flava]RBL93839.1 fatty acid hydroxylase [Chitinophaga flava]